MIDRARERITISWPPTSLPADGSRAPTDNNHPPKEPLDMDQHLTLNLDDFDLDIRVVHDDIPDDGLVPCNTDDGCGSTCASACTNSGV